MPNSRYQKIKAVLDKRQVDLTLCLDEVHKHHNLSAIVRSADAVGIHHIHSVWRDLEFDFGGDPLAHHYVGKDSHH